MRPKTDYLDRKPVFWLVIAKCDSLFPDLKDLLEVKEMESVLIFFDEAILSLEQDFISGVPPAPSRQMQHIKMQLIRIRGMIEQNRIPEKNKRDCGIARKIVDEWAFTDTGEKIIKALSEYKKL